MKSYKEITDMLGKGIGVDKKAQSMRIKKIAKPFTPTIHMFNGQPINMYSEEDVEKIIKIYKSRFFYSMEIKDR